MLDSTSYTQSVVDSSQRRRKLHRLEIRRGEHLEGRGYLASYRTSDRKRGRDGTVYSDYHASGGFLAHHLARISMAAVYWDAQHIDEGVRFLKQHAQPHA